MANEDDPFQATMRIDIPPDLLEQMNTPRPGVDPVKRHTHTTVIRIPGKKADASVIGGQDFQELLQNIYDGALITDLNGGILSANIRAIQFLIYSKEELCKQNIIGLISGASEGLLQTILETLQNDRFVLIQACLMRKDGSYFPSEISVNRLHLTGKDYLSFFIRDITLRKEAEERLRTGYNAIQNAGSGIAIADISASLSYCNPAILKLLGVETPEETQGENIRTFMAEESRADDIVTTVLRGEPWSGELEMKRKDGSTFFVQASVAPNLNADGDLVGMVFSLLDISVLKQTQRQLEDYADQLKEKNAQMVNDLNMARDIQQAFLPRHYPVFPWNATPDQSALRFSHLYYPSGAVGGDFFDILRISDTKAGIFISDVMGHGARAALVVATIRGLIEQLSSVAHDPGAFMTQLNHAYGSVFGQAGDLMFATALYLVVDISSGRIAYTDAGHPFPFRLRRDTGAVEELLFAEGSKGPAIGLFGDSIYRHTEAQLSVNDLLVFYTDGLSEAKGNDKEYYESGRMMGELKTNITLPPAQLLNELVAGARDHSGRMDFDDDVCLLGMELTRLSS
jgi:sigma-B regulation protein RsbU (phosphoserine phosphatase)